MSWGNNNNRGYGNNGGNGYGNRRGNYNNGGGNNGGNGGGHYQGNQQGNQGTRQPDAPNKVRFSSVRLGQTQQGSPSVGMCLKRDQMEKLATLLGEMLNAGLDGCKFNMTVIEGREYASGYMYVADKQQQQQQRQGQGYAQGQQKQSYYSNGYNNGGNGNFANKQDARSYVQSKRIPDEAAPQENSQAPVPQGQTPQG